MKTNIPHQEKKEKGFARPHLYHPLKESTPDLLSQKALPHE
jgi:hypothetical protein